MILRRKQLSRLREIGAVLVKHGWGHLLTRLGLAEMLYCRGKEVCVIPETPARLLQALEELGPTFIKFGQLLSTRSDLLPPDYIAELSKLQDTATTIPASAVKSVILEEFGRPAEDIFAYFDDQPLAAASLGQVHAAVLQDGTQVIVKVQRPGIRATIDNDVEILYLIAQLLEKRLDLARTYGIMDVVDEFAITIHEELDYTREGHNTEHLKRNLAGEEDIHIPGVFWEYTTSRVLTLERINGIKITDLPRLDAAGVDRSKIANRLASVFYKQIFVDGFFHADPHPGNLLVTSEQNLGIIDAGQVRSLDLAARTGLIRLLIAYEQQNTRDFAEEIVNLGISQGEVDLPALTRDLEKLLRQYYDLPASSTDLGRILMRVMDTSAKHRIRLPTGFTVVGKVLADIDGINRLLDPDWNFTESVKPYLSRAVREQLNLHEIALDSYKALIDAKNFFFDLPEHLNQILRKTAEGSLRIEFRHRGLEDLESRLDKGTNRLAFALIVSAIIISSSVIVVAYPGPRSFFGLPALGIAGYIIALVLGLWLLISIMRSGLL